MKLFKGMENLFKRAENTEARYQEALEKKQEELIHLQGELQEKQFMLKDMHKMKLLGDVSSETYEAEAEQVHQLHSKVQEVKKEMELITVYQTEDVKTVIEEIEAEKQKVLKDHNKELDKLKLELLEAKHTYFQKLIDAREKYNQLVEPERRLDKLKIKLGIKKNSYVSGSTDALSLYSTAGGGYENLFVQNPDVFNALEYGKMPQQLDKLLKDKGVI